MQDQEPRSNLPSIDRLSTLSATILLAYALAHFINLPTWEPGVQLPGFYLSAKLNIQTLTTFLVAGLTAAGADWLLREHPALVGRRHRTFEHWLVPTLTALVIGIPLAQLPLGPIWWIGFALGGALIVLVLIAEYIVVDQEDVRQPPAAAVLTAVSFALYLILAAGLRFAGSRLYLLVPALALAAGLVSLRALRLRLRGPWYFMEAGLVALITTQIAAALHYWPISPVAFGLALLGPAYALTHLMGNLAEGEPIRQAVTEPVVVLILIWVAALLIG